MAVGESLGDAYIDVLANTDKLGSGLDRARQITTQSIKGIVATAAGMLGVGLSVGGAVKGMMSAIEKGGALYDLSQQTGIAVKDLAILQQAFENAGVSAGMVPRSIMQMQKALASQKMGDAFKNMGLNTKELGGMDAVSQFGAIGKALNNIKDPAERTAAAMKVFGRSGFMLKGLFADPNAVKDARENLGMMPEVVAKMAKTFDEFGDALSTAKKKMSGFWAGILFGFKPAIEAVTKFMNKFDFAKKGLEIGIWISAFTKAIKAGKLGDLLSLSLQIGSITALNYMLKGFQFLFIAVKKIIKDTFATLSDSDFWIGLGKTVGGVFLALGAGLIELFTTPIKYMDAAFTVLFSRITGPWANGISKALLGMMSPMASVFDTLTGGKVSEKIADLISGVSASDRKDSKKGTSFKDALAQSNRSDTWLESQGKKAGILAGKWLDDGLSKLHKSTKNNMGAIDYAGLFASFMENAKDMFPTEDLKKQFADIMKPFLDKSRREFDKLPPGENKKGGSSPSEKESRGFVGFRDAIRKAQEDNFSKAEQQRDKQIELLTSIRDGNKGAQNALFGE